MPESNDVLKENHAKVREDSEYVRLVMPSELRKPELDVLEFQRQERKKSRIWWVKTMIWCSITVITLLVFVKWGMPFLVKKVLFPILQWEATAFGRPVLALVLVGSLALFPVFFIPSGPSMWLAGMIFGYGIGFIIIMVGTTIGMILPFLVGLLFRDRIHQWLKRWPQKAAMIRLAAEGSWFHQFRVVALFRITFSVHSLQLCDSGHKYEILALFMRISCRNDSRILHLHLQRSANKDISRRQVWEPSADSSGDHLQRDLLHYCNHHNNCFHRLCQEEVERSGDTKGR